MKSLIYKFNKPNKLVAAFDLDGTLIKTKSGNKFPKNSTDYQYAFDNIQEKINELLLQKYKIVIFTNQRGIGLNKIKKEEIIDKIEKLFPFAEYFISTDKDLYRKPMIGMYEKFIELNGKITDMFYVGDAAGRKGDHSYDDINFAYNSKIKFYTEIQYFKNKKEDVKPYCPEQKGKVNDISQMKVYDSNVVIMMQGFPGSGKTSFVKDYIRLNKIKNYLHLSNDIQKTKAKLKKEFNKGIENNSLIFIDNTNATKNNRKEIIDLIKNNEDYSVIGIHITTDEEMSMALNKQRYYISNTDKDYKGKVYSKLGNVVYNVYKKRFEEMELNEGFYKIYKFLPDIKLKYCFV